MHEVRWVWVTRLRVSWLGHTFWQLAQIWRQLAVLLLASGLPLVTLRLPSLCLSVAPSLCLSLSLPVSLHLNVSLLTLHLSGCQSVSLPVFRPGGCVQV